MEEQDIAADAGAIAIRLDELAEVRVAVEVTRRDYEAKRAEIMKAVQEELAALEAEYTPLLETAAERVRALEVEIKDEVARHGASVKGRHFHAVYVRGRVSWDTKSLDGYARVHPEVLAFRKEGEPSISLRAIRS
jgi:phage host-nuclease inhibitor protein Gam